jgi:hypothetical protein
VRPRAEGVAADDTEAAPAIAVAGAAAGAGAGAAVGAAVGAAAGAAASAVNGVDWASDPLGLGASLPRLLQPTGATAPAESAPGKGAPGTALLVELDRTSGRLPPGVVPPVWVGADRFGRSKGIGLVFVRSAREAHKVVRLLDGFELNGRAVSARHDDSFARAQKIGLPRFEPLWLRKLAAGLGQRLGTEPEPVEPLVATNESIDTTGKAW